MGFSGRKTCAERFAANLASAFPAGEIGFGTHEQLRTRQGTTRSIATAPALETVPVTRSPGSSQSVIAHLP